MVAKRPAPAIAGREWSCGFCAPAGAGICRDQDGRCHEMWSGFKPPTAENPGGDVLCACAVAGHPREKTAVIIPVADVQLPEISEEVA